MHARWDSGQASLHVRVKCLFFRFQTIPLLRAQREDAHLSVANENLVQLLQQKAAELHYS